MGFEVRHGAAQTVQKGRGGNGEARRDIPDGREDCGISGERREGRQAATVPTLREVRRASLQSEDGAVPVWLQSLGFIMITLDEVKGLYNRGELPYRLLIDARSQQLKRAFVAWRLEVLGGICPVCGKSLKRGSLVIDHQHALTCSGARYGYVRDIVHTNCNAALGVLEQGCSPKQVPAHLVNWYRTVYARMDEERPPERKRRTMRYFTTRLDARSLEELRQMADEDRRSVALVIEQAVNEYLARRAGLSLTP